MAGYSPNGTTDPVENVVSKLDGVKRTPNGYTARCPSHEDRQPSLSIAYGTDGKAILNCFGPCAPEDIVSALGLTMADLFPATERPNGSPALRPVRPRRVSAPAKQRREEPPAQVTGQFRYQVCDTNGTLVATHMRVEHADGTKKYLWQQPSREYGLKGRPVESLPLFGSEQLAALPDDATVVVCEGEKAAVALRCAGLNAVGTVTGAKKAPSIDVLRCLARFNVVLWPDNDDAGREHMHMVAERLLSLEARS